MGEILMRVGLKENFLGQGEWFYYKEERNGGQRRKNKWA